MQKNEIRTLRHPYAQRKMISLDLIAKVMSAPLSIFSGNLKECPTLVCFVSQDTNCVCESLDNAFLFCI